MISIVQLRAVASRFAPRPSTCPAPITLADVHLFPCYRTRSRRTCRGGGSAQRPIGAPPPAHWRLPSAHCFSQPPPPLPPRQRHPLRRCPELPLSWRRRRRPSRARSRWRGVAGGATACSTRKHALSVWPQSTPPVFMALATRHRISHDPQHVVRCTTRLVSGVWCLSSGCAGTCCCGRRMAG
jgi:hypothetical protein